MACSRDINGGDYSGVCRTECVADPGPGRSQSANLASP